MKLSACNRLSGTVTARWKDAIPGDQRSRLTGRTKGGKNTRLHAVTDAEGRPIRCFRTAGQVRDDICVAALLGSRAVGRPQV